GVGSNACWDDGSPARSRRTQRELNKGFVLAIRILRPNGALSLLRQKTHEQSTARSERDDERGEDDSLIVRQRLNTGLDQVKNPPDRRPLLRAIIGKSGPSDPDRHLLRPSLRPIKLTPTAMANGPTTQSDRAANFGPSRGFPDCLCQPRAARLRF